MSCEHRAPNTAPKVEESETKSLVASVGRAGPPGPPPMLRALAARRACNLGARAARPCACAPQLAARRICTPAATPAPLRWLTLAKGRVHGAYRAYDGLLQSHRLATTTASGAVLAWLGDACTQWATQPGAYDVPRGVAFGAFGAFLTGPVNYFWLNHLAELVTRLAPAGGMYAVLVKVGIQTFFFQPVVYVPLFFGFTAAFRGWSAEAAWGRVKAEYPGTLRSLWAFWTPICVFVFAVLPVRQQAICFSASERAPRPHLAPCPSRPSPLAHSLPSQPPLPARSGLRRLGRHSHSRASRLAAVSLGWNAILSFLTNRPSREPVGAPAEAEQRKRGLVRTPSGRWLPTHQPPMGIIDNDPEPAPPKPALSDQRMIGFLLGPGLW